MCVFIFLSMFVSVCGFLMDTNTPSGSGLIGAPITDQNYIALFDKIAQEKHARRLVQQYIIGLQKELDVAKQEIVTLHKQDNISCKESDISNIEKDTFILRQNANQLKADHSSLKTEVNILKESNKQIALKNEQLKLSYVQLHQNLSVVFADNVILKEKLKDFQNATSTIISDFQNFINSKYGKQLALLRTIQNEKDTFLPKIQTVNQQIDALKRTSISRTQDFVAFIRGIGSLKSMINELGKGHQYIEKNIADINKDSSKMRKALEVFNNNTMGHVQTYNQGPRTFCGVRSSIHQSGVKLHYAGTGSHQVEQVAITASGLYVISATVMSNSGQAYYYVVKNNDRLSVCHVRDNGDTGLSHTCTSIIAAQLDAGDRISVETGTDMEAYGPGTCLTITRIH